MILTEAECITETGGGSGTTKLYRYMSQVEYDSVIQNQKFVPYETAKQSLLVDIASSAEIDAVLLNGLDKNSLIEKEALDNLYEYFQNSEVISESDFMVLVESLVKVGLHNRY